MHSHVYPLFLINLSPRRFFQNVGLHIPLRVIL